MTEHPSDDAEPTLGHWFGPWGEPEAIADDDPDLGWGPPDPSLLQVEAPEPPRRSAYWEGPRWAWKTAIIAVVLVVLAAGAGWPITEPSARFGSPYVAGAGHRTLLGAGSAGTVVRETGRLTGANVLSSSLPDVNRISDRLGQQQFGVGSFFAAESRVERSGDGSSSQELTLLHLLDTGAVVEGTITPRQWTAFSPALPLLPRDLAAGRSWEGLGTATQGAHLSDDSTTLPYHFSASAADAGSGCVRLTWALQIGKEPQSRHDETRCREQGITAETRTVGGRSATWASAPSFPDTDDPRAAVRFDAPAPWQHPDRFTTLDLSTDNPEIKLGHPAEVAAQTVDQTIVIKDINVGALVGMTRSGRKVATSWVSYPGRIVVGAWSYGTVVVAATDTELVAYNSQGDWLWSVRQPEVVTARPAQTGDAIVVVRQDGSISSYDLRSGAERWSRHLRADVRTAPAACGDRVIVGTQKPELAGLDTATGETLWQQGLDRGPKSLACAAGTAVALTDGGDLVAFSTHDGSQLWTNPSGLGADVVLATESGRVYWNNEEGVRARDLATGDQVWTRQAVVQALGTDGRSLIVQLLERGVIIDEAGEPIGRWDVPLSTKGTVLVTSDGAWIQSSAGLSFVGAP